MLFILCLNIHLNVAQLMGVFVTGGIAITTVLNSGTISSTAAGLMLIYSMSFGENVSYLARKYSDVSNCHKC